MRIAGAIVVTLTLLLATSACGTPVTKYSRSGKVVRDAEGCAALRGAA